MGSGKKTGDSSSSATTTTTTTNRDGRDRIIAPEVLMVDERVDQLVLPDVDVLVKYVTCEGRVRQLSMPVADREIAYRQLTADLVNIVFLFVFLESDDNASGNFETLFRQEFPLIELKYENPLTLETLCALDLEKRGKIKTIFPAVLRHRTRQLVVNFFENLFYCDEQIETL
jgi:hypothetical protein